MQLNLTFPSGKRRARTPWEGTAAGTAIGHPGELVGREAQVQWRSGRQKDGLLDVRWRSWMWKDQDPEPILSMRLGRAVANTPPLPSLIWYHKPGFYGLGLEETQRLDSLT